MTNLVALLTLAATLAHGATAANPALLAALPASRHTLEEGIRQVAAAPAVAISAKLELHDGALALSVYTAGRGLAAEAEANTLAEWIGPATTERWEPVTEVFADVAHVARSAEQLTVMRTAGTSLVNVVARARRDRRGTVFSVAPSVRAGHPVFVVLVADGGRVEELVYPADSD